jgi:hypothetical protein
MQKNAEKQQQRKWDHALLWCLVKNAKSNTYTPPVKKEMNEGTTHLTHSIVRVGSCRHNGLQEHYPCFKTKLIIPFLVISDSKANLHVVNPLFQGKERRDLIYD